MASNQPSSSNSAPDSTFTVFDEAYVAELRARIREGPDSASSGSPYESIQRYVASLVHACQCPDADCRRMSCHKMKRVVQHTKLCKKRISGACPVCKQLIALCCYHAKHCNRDGCTVPFCMDIRQKLAEQKMIQDSPLQLSLPDYAKLIGVNGNSKGSAEAPQFGSPSMNSGHIPDSPSEGFHYKLQKEYLEAQKCRPNMGAPPMDENVDSMSSTTAAGFDEAAQAQQLTPQEQQHQQLEQLQMQLTLQHQLQQQQQQRAVAPTPMPPAATPEIEQLAQQQILQQAEQQARQQQAKLVARQQAEREARAKAEQEEKLAQEAREREPAREQQSQQPTTIVFGGGSSSSTPHETPNQAPESVKDVKKPSVEKCKETATDSNSGDPSGVNGFVFHDSMSSLLARLLTGNGDQDSEIREIRKVNFSPQQSEALEQQFAINKDLTPEIEAELARRTSLTEAEVKIWFQDRQFRQKRARNNEEAKKSRFLRKQCKCVDSMSSGPTTAAGTAVPMLKEEDPETSNQAPESVKDVKKPSVVKCHRKETTFGIDASEPSSSFEACKLPEGFSRQQVEVLERNFSIIQFPPRFDRKHLAENIGLKESQVKKWFQNRRREEEDKEEESDSDCDYGLMEQQPNVKKEEEGWYKVAREISDFSKMMVPVALLIFLVCMIMIMLTVLFK